jgi:hypothetical protein
MLPDDPLLRLGLAIFVLNLPFGFWRARCARMSRSWFIAIHAPVPIVIAMRLAAGVPWTLANVPVLFGSFFLGQFVGGLIRRVVASAR